MNNSNARGLGIGSVNYAAKRGRRCAVVAILIVVQYLVGTGTFLAAPPPLEVPPPDEVLSTLRPEHPRLLLTRAEVEQLKGRIAGGGVLESWLRKLRVAGDTLLTQNASRYEIPDGLRLLATSRRVMDRTATLGLLYQLTNEKKYAERAWKELEAAGNFPDWNPRHFLDTAEMTFAFALGYDWLHSFWSEEQKRFLGQAIVQKGLTNALPMLRGDKGWAAVHHNWNQVCNGGMALGALAIAETEPALSSEILYRTLRSIPRAMREFAPDGAWNEGPGYWNYATAYNTYLLSGLETALGKDFGLSDIEGYDQAGMFPIYTTGPTGLTFNYADAKDHLGSSPQLFWMGQRYRQPAYAWFQAKCARPSAFDLVWLREPGKSPEAAQWPLNKYFRGSEIAIFRSSWESSNASFAGLKAGDNKANHSNLDLGSFIYEALGVRWAVDLGSDDYNLPGYFGKARWTYYRLRAEGHNTLVLNPGAEPGQDPVAKAPMAQFSGDSTKPFAITDLTAAYRPHATEVKRGLALLGKTSLLVQDEIQAAKGVEAWWFMHTPARIEVTQDGRSAILTEKQARVEARILSPAEGTFSVMDAQPLPSSPHPENQAANKGIKKLAIHFPRLTQATIAVLLIPDSSEAVKAVSLKPLADWD
jgi:hypothetical protein